LITSSSAPDVEIHGNHVSISVEDSVPIAGTAAVMF